MICVIIKVRHAMQLVLIRTGTRQKNPERIATARIHRKSIKFNVSMLERKRLTTSKRD